ncbi:M56 family metallopeptidase [Nocardia sp. NPDC050193]
MKVMVLPLLLVAVLAATAIAGPWLLRAAAPVLMRVPRLAVLLLGGGLLLWLLSAAGLSLTLAWMVTGPSVLPAPAAEVCQRCLDAASPLTLSGTIETGIPVVLLLILPALLLVLMLALSTRGWLQRHRATLSFAHAVTDHARRTRLCGHTVLIIEDSKPIVFSLPRRSGGIVVSDGLLTVLEPGELAAVLEHEYAHLRQHHHLAVALLGGLARPLRWLPMAAAIADAVPHYLEIAADNAARRHVGTAALAAALLKLGTPKTGITLPVEAGPDGAVLHAAGPERIRHLIDPAATGVAALPAALLAFQLAAFTVVTAGIHGHYLYAAFTGCSFPA